MANPKAARSKKVVFVTRGGLDYGWGHIFRSLSFSDYLTSKEKCSVKLLVYGDRAVKKMLDNEGIEYFFLGEKSKIKKEESILRHLSYDVLINDTLFASQRAQRLYVSKSPLTVFFNDLGYDYALGDIVVSPQYLYRYARKRPGITFLNGPEYFIVNKNILSYAKDRKTIKKEARSILVMGGGSIKRSIFDRLVRLINTFKDYDFKIKIALGCDHDFDLGDYPVSNNKKITLLKDVSGVGRYINEADLVLSSSGYLKYEAAFLKTPLALFSINGHQRQLGECFVKRGNAGIYLGDMRKDNLKTFSKKVISLMQNYKMRRIFSKHGCRIVDGRGPERIYNAVMRRAG